MFRREKGTEQRKKADTSETSFGQRHWGQRRPAGCRRYDYKMSLSWEIEGRKWDSEITVGIVTNEEGSSFGEMELQSTIKCFLSITQLFLLRFNKTVRFVSFLVEIERLIKTHTLTSRCESQLSHPHAQTIHPKKKLLLSDADQRKFSPTFEGPPSPLANYIDTTHITL